MIEDFSGGYYRTKMTVQPVDSGPCIERGLHDLIERRLYQNTDAPITMRFDLDGGARFRPHGEGAMPTDVIGMPTERLDAMNVHPSAENVNVFILKPKHAYLFYQAAQVGNNTSTNSDNSLDDIDKDFFDLEGN